MRRTGRQDGYPGLARGRTAQSDGFTAARTTNNDPRRPYETISISSAKNQRFDATTGALTVVPGSPFAAGNQSSSVAIDPTGMFTYVVNSGADTVSVYAIDATTGALTPISASSIATGTQPTAIAISD